MASVVASKVVTPKPVFLTEFLVSPSASGKTAASAYHLFGTGGAPPRSSSDGIKDSSGKDADDGIKDSSGKDAAADCRREHDLPIPNFFTGGVLDVLPEAVRRDLLQALAEDGGAVSISGFTPRGWWVSKEDGDAVQLKVAMPGLGKENVKMKAEKDTLVVKGEGDKDSEDDGKGPARYSYRIGLSSHAFKMDQIKAEMKNGVLILTVPKIKDEERKDVFEIKVE